MGPEDQLNLAFAEMIAESAEFRRWVIEKTKFAGAGTSSKLLREEQAAARSAKYWWRHWWCFVPEVGAESETDIFLAFEESNSKKRFALHFENKIENSTFQPNQAESYDCRARHMLTNTKSATLRCTEFDTILIAPASFHAAYEGQCAHFGCFIAHEEIARFIPQFGRGRTI